MSPPELAVADRPAIPPVLIENLEEVEFLSIQGRKLFCDYETTHPELVEHEGRIDAHLDSLRIAAEAAVPIAVRGLDEAVFAWELFAAARVWLELALPKPDLVWERIAGASPDLLSGWREAFRRLPASVVRSTIPVAPADSSAARAIHTDAFGWHGLLDTAAWDAAARDEDALVRAAAARIAGLDRHGPGDPDALLADDDVSVRRRALWSLALRDPTAAKGHARGDANADEPDDFSFRVLGIVGSARDVAILARHAERRPATLHALGDLGDPAALDLLLRLFDSDDPSIAAAAMDGALTIVGPPTATDPETDELDPMQVRALVEEKRGALRLGERYVRGAPFAADANPDEDVTELVWKRSVLVAEPLTAPWRREVPDGFFDAVPLSVAVPGE